MQVAQQHSDAMPHILQQVSSALVAADGTEAALPYLLALRLFAKRHPLLSHPEALQVHIACPHRMIADCNAFKVRVLWPIVKLHDMLCTAASSCMVCSLLCMLCKAPRFIPGFTMLCVPATSLLL